MLNNESILLFPLFFSRLQNFLQTTKKSFSVKLSEGKSSCLCSFWSSVDFVKVKLAKERDETSFEVGEGNNFLLVSTSMISTWWFWSLLRFSTSVVLIKDFFF